MARNSSFTQKIADEICGQIAEGRSLRAICGNEGMPDKATVLRWLADERYQSFRDQYARAREAQADALAEEILEIADDGKQDSYVDENGNTRTDQEVIGRSRLRVDARKWLASKLAPKKYGDKIETTLKGGIAVQSVKDLTDDELANIAAGSSAGASGKA